MLKFKPHARVLRSLGSRFARWLVQILLTLRLVGGGQISTLIGRGGFNWSPSVNAGDQNRVPLLARPRSCKLAADGRVCGHEYASTQISGRAS